MSLALTAFAKMAAAAIGHAKSMQAAEEKNQKIGKLTRENNAEDNRVSYRDPSQSILAQYALRKTFDNIRRRNEQAAGTAAVMNMGPANVATVMQGNAEEGAETAARVAANEASRQDQLHAQHQQRKRELENMDLAETESKRQSIANATQNAFNTFGDISQNIGGNSTSKSAPTDEVGDGEILHSVRRTKS